MTYRALDGEGGILQGIPRYTRKPASMAPQGAVKIATQMSPLGYRRTKRSPPNHVCSTPDSGNSELTPSLNDKYDTEQEVRHDEARFDGPGAGGGCQPYRNCYTETKWLH